MNVTKPILRHEHGGDTAIFNVPVWLMSPESPCFGYKSLDFCSSLFCLVFIWEQMRACPCTYTHTRTCSHCLINLYSYYDGNCTGMWSEGSGWIGDLYCSDFNMWLCSHWLLTFPRSYSGAYHKSNAYHMHIIKLKVFAGSGFAWCFEKSYLGDQWKSRWPCILHEIKLTSAWQRLSRPAYSKQSCHDTQLQTGDFAD